MNKDGRLDAELIYSAAGGEIFSGGEQFQVVSARAKRARYRPDEPWEIEFTLGGPDRVGPGQPLPRFRGDAVFRLQGWLGGNLRIGGITSFRHSGAHHSARAWRLDHNSEDLPEKPRQQHVIVSFVNAPTPPLQMGGEPIPDPDSGEVESWPIQTACGPARYLRGQDVERLRGSSEDGEARFWVPKLQLDLEPRRFRKRIETFEDALGQDLQDICVILALIGRRHAAWHSISILSLMEDGHVETAVSHRPGPPPVDSRDVAPLIHSKPFGAEAFHSLLENFRAHDLKATIEAAVVYTTAYYNSEYDDARLVYAFTALEALVNGWSASRNEDVLVSDRDFATLRSVVQPVVRRWAKAEGLDTATRKQLYAKIGELRRPPIIPRVVRIVDSLSIQWDDLWEAGAGLAASLEQAYGRRSQFLHQGTLPEWPSARRDAIRVAVLAERIVFALLGGSADWIWPPAYWEVRRERGL